MKNMYWVASITIGCAFISLMTVISMAVSQEIINQNNSLAFQGMYLLFAMPLFLFAGLPIGLSHKWKHKNKMLATPLLMMVPIFSFIPLASIFSNNQDLKNLALYVVLGPPVAVFYWLALAFLGQYQRRIFYFMITFFCFFFWIPVFVFFALSE